MIQSKNMIISEMQAKQSNCDKKIAFLEHSNRSLVEQINSLKLEIGDFRKKLEAKDEVIDRFSHFNKDVAITR